MKKKIKVSKSFKKNTEKIEDFKEYNQGRLAGDAKWLDAIEGPYYVTAIAQNVDVEDWQPGRPAVSIESLRIMATDQRTGEDVSEKKEPHIYKSIMGYASNRMIDQELDEYINNGRIT